MVVNLLTYLNVLTHCSTTPSACRASPTYRRSSSGPSASRRPSSASTTAGWCRPRRRPEPSSARSRRFSSRRTFPRTTSPSTLYIGSPTSRGPSRAATGRCAARSNSSPSYIALHTVHTVHLSRPYTPYTHPTYTPLDRCGSLKFTTKFPHAVLATFVRSFPIVQRLAELSCTALNEAFVCHTGLEPQI